MILPYSYIIYINMSERKKNVARTILEIIIAIASAILGAIGGATLS